MVQQKKIKLRFGTNNLIEDREPQWDTNENYDSDHSSNIKRRLETTKIM